MTENEYRTKLLEITKRAYADKMFAATSGNLSMLDRETGRLYITPGSYPYELMREDDIVVIDIEGNVLSAKAGRRPSSEWYLHAAIYAACPQYCAVVHTHSPYATALAINHTPVPATLFELVWFLGGDVPVSAPACPGSRAVGDNAVKVMADGTRYGCLMANHGAVAAADSLEMAYTRAVYIEDAAKAYVIAKSCGNPVVLTEAQCEEMRK